MINHGTAQVVMRERQLESFRRTDCAAMCTVKGLLEAHGLRPNGEITPTHMCEILQEVSMFVTCRSLRCLALADQANFTVDRMTGHVPLSYPLIFSILGR